MAVFKCSFFFEQRKYGWSETLYITRANHVTAMQACNEVALLRIRLLGGLPTGDNPRLSNIRVSDVSIQRDALVNSIPAGSGSNPDTLDGADNPNLAILLRLDANPLYRRQLYMRGFPDFLVSNNGIYVPDPRWNIHFERWARLLIEREFGMLAIVRPPAPTAILGLEVVAVEVAVNTAAPHSLATGNSVRMVSVPGIRQLQGNWTVRVTTPTQFVLVGSGPLISRVPFYLGGGSFYQRLPGFFALSQIQVLRATHRITGRPFDSPLGRRRRKTA